MISALTLTCPWKFDEAIEKGEYTVKECPQNVKELVECGLKFLQYHFRNQDNGQYRQIG
jgi:hypothetical protein